MTTTNRRKAPAALRAAVDEAVSSLTQLAGELAEPEQAIAAVERPKADVAPLVRAYKRAEKRAAAAKESLESAKAAILEAMGGAELLKIAETQQPVAEHREVQAMVLDTTKLKREQPEVAAQYQRTRVQHRFSVLV